MQIHLKGMIHMYLLLHYYKQYYAKIVTIGIDNVNIDQYFFNYIELF